MKSLTLKISATEYTLLFLLIDDYGMKLNKNDRLVIFTLMQMRAKIVSKSLPNFILSPEKKVNIILTPPECILIYNIFIANPTVITNGLAHEYMLLTKYIDSLVINYNL